MGNTLGYFPFFEKWKLLFPNEQHSALQVFLVLKGIFRHLSDAELANARLVDRQWNFVAMSELASRRFHLSTIKLYQFSSNQFRDRNYGWYLSFENKRRSLWTDLYGTDCPILEFRHLHFGHPEETEDFLKILRSPWLNSVTSLTLSVYSETCEDFVLNWFLPSLPNLQNLSCFIKPEVNFESAWSDLQGLDQDHDSRSNNSLELKPEGQDRQIGSKLHSFSVCFEKACSFQWSLLGSFPRLEDLKLEFGDAAAMIKCAHELTTGERVLAEIKGLEITLTHKPNLKEQVKDAELNAVTLAMAAAKLCNQFRVRQSLNVISMIPAAHFLDFLEELTATGLKKIKFEIAAPLYIGLNANAHILNFLNGLIPEILFRFPDLEDLRLQFLQYHPTIHLPIQFPSSRQILDLLDPALERRLKQLHFSTVAAEVKTVERNPVLRGSYCQRVTMFYNSSWFQGVVELDVQANCWQDCVEVIDITGTNLKCVKKLVLRNIAPNVHKQRMGSMFFFPEVNRRSFPNKWFFGRKVSRKYKGLPGIQCLEVFRVEQFGILYHPVMASEIGQKMPRLKSIQLDDEFNYVIHESLFLKLVSNGMAASTTTIWPSYLEHVKILTNTAATPCFRVEEKSSVFQNANRTWI